MMLSPASDAMIPISCLTLAAFISPRQIWATAGTSASLSPGHRVHHTHMFHMKPRAIISSVLTDVRRQTLTEARDESSLLSIDVSSNDLDDGAAVSLMEELMSLLKSRDDVAHDSEGGTIAPLPLSIKLALVMNNLSPSGASRLFEVMKNVTAIPTEDGNAGDGEAAIEMENESDSVMVLDNSSKINEITDEDTTNKTTSADQTSAYGSQIAKVPEFLIEEVDLSFNDIGGHGIHPPNVQLLNSVRKLFEGGGAAFIPRTLSLENCGLGPAFCRQIGRGILNAFERKHNGARSLRYRPSVLRMGGNDAIGDAGAVALAAALRLAMDNDGDDTCVLEELDISSCGVGDVGAEALALALSSNPGCLKRLNLSNNKITNAGSKALGRALVDASHSSGAIFEEVILDNNVRIGDDGAAALADAMSVGAVKSISMRSCAVQAPGVAEFGKALVSLACRKSSDGPDNFHIDLSGNHFGTRKVKKKKGAALIRDKASTNIKFIGKTLKGAARRFGSETMGITAESDDDEEVMGGLVDEEEEEIFGDKLQSCGGLAFAGEILRSEEHSSSQMINRPHSLKISIGMRQCYLDDGAIDALSAVVVGAKSCDISVDVSMNSVEENVVDVLKSTKKDSKLLMSMAGRHMDFLDRIADARQRQLDAAEAVGGTFFDDDEADEDVYDEVFDYDEFD